MASFRGLPSAVLVACGFALCACSTPDYAGVQSFSDAVTSMSDADAALTTAANQAAINQWVKHSAKSGSQIVVDFGKCRADPTQYVAGSCTVAVGDQAPPSDAPDLAFASLVHYAASLVAVTNDTSCGALQSDAAALGSDLQGMADAAKSAGLAAAAGEVTSIASQAGCFFIARTQLAILRKATTDAAPVVAALVAVIEQREMQLYGIIRDDDLAQIKDAGDDYQATGSAADLADVAALTASLDRAQRAPAYAAVAQLTDLHGALQAGLAAPTVDLAGVVKAARALIDKARDAEGAASALGDSAVRSHDASAKRETASPPAPRRKGNGGKAAVHEAHSA